MVLVAPSLLAADFSALGSELERVASADMLHIDVMDGRFVPNLTLGPMVVAALRGKTALPFDVHLMLSHPLPFVRPFCQAGANRVTFHAECEDNPTAVLAEITACGALPGMAISPETPPQALAKYGSLLNSITVMTVSPGFGGQKLIPQTLEKLPWLRQNLPGVQLEVDGGVNAQTAPLCVAKGAQILVAGTAVFGAPSPAAAIKALRGVQLAD